jgi:hypothetical protein
MCGLPETVSVTGDRPYVWVHNDASLSFKPKGNIMSTTHDSGVVKMGSAFRLPSAKNTSLASRDAGSSLPTEKENIEANTCIADALPVGGRLPT